MLENKRLFYILMFISMFFWGLSWVNGKVLTSYITAYEMVFIRNLLTIISLIPILIYTKIYFKIDIKNLFLSFLASIFLILYAKYYFWGLNKGTAMLGGTFVTTLIPILTFILMKVIYKKNISLKDTFALALGVVGVLTMIQIWTFNIQEIFIDQNLYFFIAALCWSTLTIVCARSKDVSPVIFSFYMYIIATIIVAILFVKVDEIPFNSFDTIFWINIFTLSILSTSFATTIYFLAIEKIGAKETTAFVLLVPFFAILTSFIFLGEKINISAILGTTLTIIALSVLNNIVKLKKRN